LNPRQIQVDLGENGKGTSATKPTIRDRCRHHALDVPKIVLLDEESAT
jgi:hypothetical protein